LASENVYIVTAQNVFSSFLFYNMFNVPRTKIGIESTNEEYLGQINEESTFKVERLITVNRIISDGENCCGILL